MSTGWCVHGVPLGRSCRDCDAMERRADMLGHGLERGDETDREEVAFERHLDRMGGSQ